MTSMWKLAGAWPLTLVGLLWLLPACVALAGVSFGAAPARDSAGFFSLDWSGAERVELEQSTGPDYRDARIVYRGADTRTTISGLPDGEYRFRIRPEGAPEWSDQAVVVVEHHSLGRALLFFGLGAGVFAVLMLAIAGGRRLS